MNADYEFSPVITSTLKNKAESWSFSSRAWHQCFRHEKRRLMPSMEESEYSDSQIQINVRTQVKPAKRCHASWITTQGISNLFSHSDRQRRIHPEFKKRTQFTAIFHCTKLNHDNYLICYWAISMIIQTPKTPPLLTGKCVWVFRLESNDVHNVLNWFQYFIFNFSLCNGDISARQDKILTLITVSMFQGGNCQSMPCWVLSIDLCFSDTTC